MKPLCKKYGIEFTEAENQPLGRKKNAGLNAAMKFDFDYLIELGSDDLILNSVFDYYLPHMKAGEPLFGSNRMLFVDGTTGECRAYQSQESQYGHGWGLGRAMSRKMLQAIGGRVKVKALTGVFAAGEIIPEGTTSFLPRKSAEGLQAQGFVEIVEDADKFYLWTDEASRVLDNDSNERLLQHGYRYKTIETPETFLVDIKTDENIWPFNPEIGKAEKFDEFLSKLSQGERQTFFAILKKSKAPKIEYA